MALRRMLAKVSLGSSLIALMAAGGVGVARGATTSATVTVNIGSSLGTIPSTAFGLNASNYDAHLTDPAIPDLVKATGVGVMRYPGGSDADLYHWQSNARTPGNGNPVANDTFDNFMKVVSATNSQAMITSSSSG